MDKNLFRIAVFVAVILLVFWTGVDFGRFMTTRAFVVSYLGRTKETMDSIIDPPLPDSDKDKEAE